MNILDLLDRPIAYHRVFVTLTKSVKAAVLLSQAIYWQKRASQTDGWWYKTAEEWQEETGLTKHEQDTARRDCEPYLTSDLRGVPATLYWKIDEEKLTKALIQFSGKRKTRISESAKQVTRKAQNIKRNTEITTENTTAVAVDTSKLFTAYSNEIGVITSFIADDIEAWVKEVNPDWILDAIHEAAVQNKRNWKYCAAILKRWKAQGFQDQGKSTNLIQKAEEIVKRVMPIFDEEGRRVNA